MIFRISTKIFISIKIKLYKIKVVTHGFITKRNITSICNLTSPEKNFRLTELLVQLHKRSFDINTKLFKINVIFKVRFQQKPSSQNKNLSVQVYKRKTELNCIHRNINRNKCVSLKKTFSGKTSEPPATALTDTP